MIIASNNQGKIREIKEILQIDNIYSLKEKNIDVDVIEDGKTFEENAIKKAKEIYNICHETVIADDSGLCIDSLNGFPGVNTHRFLGEDATADERKNKILEKLENVKNRKAEVVCVVIYYDGENIIKGEGIIDGEISLVRKGTNGFGFDEIFLLPNGKTLAELSPEEKNNISARALALEELKNKLHKLLKINI